MSAALDPNIPPSGKPPLSALGRPGVRRLNRVPLFAVFCVAMLVMGAVIYTFHERMQGALGQGRARTSNQPQAGSAQDVLDRAPSAGLIQARPVPQPPVPPVAPRVAEAPLRHELNPIEAAQLTAWQDYEKQLAGLMQAHLQVEIAAIGATPTVKLNGGGSNYPQMASAGVPGIPGGLTRVPVAAAGAPTLDTMQAGPQGTPATTTIVPGFGGLGGAGVIAASGGIPPANPNANDQIGKRNFLAQPGSAASDDYLQASLTAPVSPFEVKAGSVIPATMIGGINSDLPGNVIAQVSQTVYDTATGRYPLIPQGARLVGVYHSGVSYGQSRVLVAWNRIIYPDGDSFDLGTMPGADEGGYAGFTDEVNNHYLRIFTSALLASVFSAAAQLSQPQSTTGTVTSSQVLTAAVGQQANEIGSQLIARGLDIQPTLEIRNGYRFNVMVTKDLILQPWGGMSALPYGAPGR